MQVYRRVIGVTSFLRLTPWQLHTSSMDDGPGDVPAVAAGAVAPAARPLKRVYDTARADGYFVTGLSFFSWTTITSMGSWPLLTSACSVFGASRSSQ